LLLGLATAALAGVLIWLGADDDEPPPVPAPVTAVDRSPPRADEIRPAAEPGPAALPTPAATPEAGVGAVDSAAAPVDVSPPSVESAAVANAPSASLTAAAPSADAPAKPAPSADAPDAAGREARSDAAPSPESPATGEPVPSDEGLTTGPVTTVYMAPACAELYRGGKRVGRSGVRVRTPEGKRRVFEVVCPGHGTRKLTLDGSRKEVMVGLRPK
jgi:hypothetical protein